MAKIDFLSERDSSDILIQNGDFVIGDNAPFQAKLILTASPGEFRQFPSLGFSIESYINSKNTLNLENKIVSYLNSNGYNVKKSTLKITMVNGKIDIDAEIS